MKIVRVFIELFNFFRVVFLICIDALLPRRSVHSRKDTSLTEKNAKLRETLLKNISNLNLARVFLEDYFIFPSYQKNCFAMFPYQSVEMKRFLWDIKYYNASEDVGLAADIWSDELISLASDRLGDLSKCLGANGHSGEESDHGGHRSSFYLIHPPSSGYTSGTKHFDQMNEIVKTMIVQRGLNLFYEYFSKAMIQQSSIAQHSGNKAERFTWAKERFQLNANFKQVLAQKPNAHIICIDDITTSGATFSAIQNLILKYDRKIGFSDRKIICFAFAH